MPSAGGELLNPQNKTLNTAGGTGTISGGGYDPNQPMNSGTGDSMPMAYNTAGGVNEAAGPVAGPQYDPTQPPGQMSISGAPVGQSPSQLPAGGPGGPNPQGNGQQPMAYAGGVASGTDPTQAGWTYGGPQGGPMNMSVENRNLDTSRVNSGGVDTSRIDPAQMPVNRVDQGANYMQNMQDAYMQQAQSRLDPQFQQREQDLQTRLANQGITPGSEAYNREMQNLAFERTDAYGNARNQAILNSGQEAARRQGMDINAGNFANTAEQQNFLNRGQSQGWQNQATGQQFGQNLAGQQAQNAANNMQFQQNLAAAGFGNQAQNQQWQQGFQNDQARNAAMAAQGGLQNQRYGSELGLQGAQAGANASMSNAALANQAANRGLGLQEQRQNWGMMTEGLMLPYQLQNLQMQGMVPGQPQMPGFTPQGQPQPGNQYYNQAGQNAQNQNQANNWASFGGSLINGLGSGMGWW